MSRVAVIRILGLYEEVDMATMGHCKGEYMRVDLWSVEPLAESATKREESPAQVNESDLRMQ